MANPQANMLYYIGDSVFSSDDPEFIRCFNECAHIINLWIFEENKGMEVTAQVQNKAQEMLANLIRDVMKNK